MYLMYIDLSKEMSLTTKSSKRHNKNELASKLYDAILKFKPIAGFKLIGHITIHTFEMTRRIDMFGFRDFYYKLRQYLISRQYDSPYFAKKLKSFPRDVMAQWKTYSNDSKKNSTSKRYRFKNKTFKMKFFPTVSVGYGISFIPYYINEIGTIKIIVDPSLLVASKNKGFDPSTYNYISISERDKDFWNEVQFYITKILSSWHILGLGLDNFTRWRITRVDFTANIMVDSHYNIKILLYYYRRTIKRRNYMNNSYIIPGQNEQSAECKNASQIFTIYNKTYEQSVRYGRYLGYNIMRFECKFLSNKIRSLEKKLMQNGKLRDNFNLSKLMTVLSQEAPFIMYNEINNVFADGDYYSRKAFKKKLKKINSHEDTKKEMVEIVEKISSFTSYNRIKEFLTLYSKSHNSNGIYYRINILQSNGISPILLDDDHSHRFNMLPSIKTVFLSAIINGFKYETSKELMFIESKVYRS